MVATLAAAEQDTWPPRVLLTASGLSIGNQTTIFRVVAGARTAVRGALAVFVDSTALVVVDAEMPFGVPVTWVLHVNGADVDTQGPVTLTLAGGKVALTDAITGLAAEVAILSVSDRARDAPSTVFNIDGKNRIISGRVGQYRATVEYFVETAAGSNAVAALLGTCTQGIILQRSPDASRYEGTDDYLAVLSAADRRFSQDGTDERRIWQVQVAQCDGWSNQLEARGYTYQDVADAYAGLTYADIAGDYLTYLALAQGDFG